jgi:hypothetical protein
MQGGIERTVFDLQDILRPLLDGMSYGVPVGRAQNQRPEDQHVQRSLKHFVLQRRLASWHFVQYTSVDYRLEALYIYTGQLGFSLEVSQKTIDWRENCSCP